ncbi:MAG: class I SAM-dependent methyltransferase [Proteobacteria bacterium]|nr:class I SAM-dependent methyltransferase [Burkholderiales bacterium]
MGNTIAPARAAVDYYRSMRFRSIEGRQEVRRSGCACASLRVGDRTLHVRRGLVVAIACAGVSGVSLFLHRSAPVLAADAVPVQPPDPGEAPAMKGFKPVLGQEGRDVVWLPTPTAITLRMLEIARVGPADRVVDLGSGDGRIPIAAASAFGARAVGVEFSPGMVALARDLAARAGVSERVRFVQGDLFAYDFRDATVVTLFLTNALNLKLRPALLALPPGTRVVSHLFTMADWLPDERQVLDERAIHLWVVPAEVGGHWRGKVGPMPAAAPGPVAPFTIDLKLTQTFQIVEGGALRDGRFIGIERLRLRGDELAFEWVQSAPDDTTRVQFVARVERDRLIGTVSVGGRSVPLLLARVPEASPGQ